jgi:hypothetical protein
MKPQDCIQQHKLISVYGCHCGAGNPDPDAGEPGEPIDQVDNACKSHDACYDTVDPPCAGAQPQLRGIQFDPRPACQKCDQDLCQSLSNADCNGWTSPKEIKECQTFRARALKVFRCLERFNIGK